MFAKRFFYVCAATLCLALAYHLGAHDAVGQSTSVIEGVNIDNGGISAVVNGVLLSFDPNTGLTYAQHPLPVAGPVAETSQSTVIYQNGDVYSWDGSWAFNGNLSGGVPTAVKKTSLGALKVRYR